MRRILLFCLVCFCTLSYAQLRSDFYWSGNSSTSDNIDQDDNWYSSGNPSSGDNLNFNNTISKHWAYSNYGTGSWFGNLITYDGAGGIKWYGDNTYAYKFENFNDGILFEIDPSSATAGSTEIGNRLNSDLEINPKGSGGILISCDRISIDNTNGARTLKVDGGNTLTIEGYIYEKNGAGAMLNILGSATVILKGNSTFTGATTISAGILELQGDLASSSVTVEDGATLKITGSDVTISSLTVNSGGIVEISAGKALTLSGDLNNSGTLTIKSTSTGTGSLIVDGSSFGDITVERYLSQNIFHYITSPINYTSGSFNDLPLGLTAGIDEDDFRRYETSSNYWIDILNGPNSNDPLMGSETFVQGKGYAIAYKGEDKTLCLSGTPNNGEINYPVSSAGSTAYAGTNLVGNPYPSTLKVSEFLADNNSIDGTINKTISSTIYFWDEPASGDFATGDYATYTEESQVAGGGGHEPTDYINPGQAFFVSASSTGYIAFRNTQREHGTATFFKEKRSLKDLKLKITNLETTDQNSIAIVFNPLATTGFDEKYDAPKWQGNPELSFYSLLEEEKLVIQSLPELEMPTSVNLGMYLGKTGNYKINLTSIENFEPNTPITLKDNLTGDQVDLSVNPEYSFFTDQTGNINDRFVLYFKSAVGIEDNPQNTAENFKIYTNQQVIYLNTTQPINKANISVFNTLGQQIVSKQLYGQSTQIRIAEPGAYIVRVQTEQGVQSQKVVIF